MEKVRQRAVELLKGAQSLQNIASDLGLTRPEPIERDGNHVLYDQMVKHPALISGTRTLFLDGHYALAVGEAYKILNNTVKKKSGLSEDGNNLMNRAFSENLPVLRLSELKTESERNEQKGYMLIMAGCMTGIRNPRAHEHEFWDDPDVAIEMIVWANHLMNIVDKAVKVRKPKKKAK